jgi:hypothetical protein
MNEIVKTTKLGRRSWLAEATDSRGELITTSGKTKLEAVMGLAEALSNQEKAQRYDVYRHEVEVLQQLAAKADFSDAGDAEFYEQRQRVKAAYRAACKDVANDQHA